MNSPSKTHIFLSRQEKSTNSFPEVLNIMNVFRTHNSSIRQKIKRQKLGNSHMGMFVGGRLSRYRPLKSSNLLNHNKVPKITTQSRFNLSIPASITQGPAYYKIGDNIIRKKPCSLKGSSMFASGVQLNRTPSQKVTKIKTVLRHNPRKLDVLEIYGEDDVKIEPIPAAKKSSSQFSSSLGKTNSHQQQRHLHRGQKSSLSRSSFSKTNQNNKSRSQDLQKLARTSYQKNRWRFQKDYKMTNMIEKYRVNTFGCHIVYKNEDRQLQ